MPASVSGKINLDIVFNNVIALGSLGKALDTEKFTFLQDLATGTFDGQINVAFAKTETAIGGAVTTAYDLIGLLKMLGGDLINFDEVVLIAIRNRSTVAANYLTIGPAAANGFGVVAANVGFWGAPADKNVVTADGDSWVVLHSKVGVPATAGTGDQLVVVTQAATAGNTWDILILGRDN